MEELPDYFDVIVIGTGMPECIIAAAAARVGKTVLHLERNGYYGGDWASFSFDKFLEWIEETKNTIEDSESNFSTDENLTSYLNENERLALCKLKSNTISNLTVKSYICDTVRESVSPHEVPVLPLPESSAPDTSEENAEPSAPSVNDSDEIDVRGDESVEVEATNSAVFNDSRPLSSEWTVSQFIENRRKFNIDLSPKILFSRGSLVELLISSNIARYAEFQCVNRVLTYINDHVEQVPCSRADVFSTKNVTVVEKRMLMKFLTFCLKFEEQEEEYKGFEDTPFLQFLRSRKLTRNVEHYIMHAIAMVDEKCNTVEGLKSTQKFLQSLGRYGKGPFLCTCYGSAELPQCFCRLCAVFGGMYYLKRNIEGIILNERCCGIVSMNQRIGCQWLVMESSYSPAEFLPSGTPQRISKGIFITDESLYPAEKKENILLKLPSGVCDSTVTIIEFSSKTYVCPEDLYVVYMICRSTNPTPEEDLMPFCDLLFYKPTTTETIVVVDTENETTTPKKPNVLWCTFFNQLDTSTVDLNSNVPDGIFITSSPDVDLDYEHAVKEAQEIFEKMCPGEEFLPRAPDPENIIIENHNNDEVEKIENDVTQPDEMAAGTTADSEKEDVTTNFEKITEDTTTDSEKEQVTISSDFEKITEEIVSEQ